LDDEGHPVWGEEFVEETEDLDFLKGWDKILYQEHYL
jgi:hypothetical protein